MKSVAVVIPCRNAERWIDRAIRSVLDKVGGYAELIVVDDGSTDRSAEIIRSFGGRLRFETGEGRGAPAARSRGLATCKSEYVLFLDADDYLAPGYLARAGANLNDGKYDLILTSYALEDEGGRRLEYHEPPGELSRTAIMSSWLTRTCSFTAAMVFRTSFLRQAGGWNQKVRILQDVEIGLRALLLDPVLGICPDAVAVYVQHHCGPRISQLRGAEAWSTVLSFLDDNAAPIRTRYDAAIRVQYGAFYYHVARTLYQAGDFDGGDVALARARDFGFLGHDGAHLDAALVAALGLKNREKLGRLKRNIAGFLAGVRGRAT